MTPNTKKPLSIKITAFLILKWLITCSAYKNKTTVIIEKTIAMLQFFLYLLLIVLFQDNEYFELQ